MLSSLSSIDACFLESCPPFVRAFFFIFVFSVTFLLLPIFSLLSIISFLSTFSSSPSPLPVPSPSRTSSPSRPSPPTQSSSPLHPSPSSPHSSSHFSPFAPQSPLAPGPPCHAGQDVSLCRSFPARYLVLARRVFFACLSFSARCSPFPACFHPHTSFLRRFFHMVILTGKWGIS
ncbi:hypothetical protein BD626DRAFT_513965 [Schizophyllum amplum]|uniref:Uncharacterized protein n=1 Tax=Schizophyllum amplum TaxID=97359 RepID=A0A550BYX4_9AGAR|nr:hypothetical protein BD626DRAFT_513965 [Auriculariopsis ampla]